MARLKITKRKKPKVERSRLLKLTPALDDRIVAAAEEKQIYILHWIRQAIVEKLEREEGGT